VAGKKPFVGKKKKVVTVKEKLYQISQEKKGKTSGETGGEHGYKTAFVNRSLKKDSE